MHISKCESNPIYSAEKKDGFQSSSSCLLTALSQTALQFGFEERVLSQGKNLGKMIKDVSKIPRATDYPHAYVRWDEGLVAQVKGADMPLYSGGFTRCFAVWARAFSKDSKEPSYLALHHVWKEGKNFESTLERLVDKIESGTIEIFISGGKRTNENNYIQVRKIIDEFRSILPNIEFSLVEDQFGIYDFGKPYQQTKNGMVYPAHPVLSYTGFDQKQRPFQIIDIKLNGHCKEEFTAHWSIN